MKITVIILLSFLCTFNGNEIPETNKKVVEFIEKMKGKQVGRGECWDLASEALNYANAKWTPPYGFGTKVNYKSEILFPGDIIQLEGITIESKKGNSTTRWKMAKHTALVYKVEGSTNLIIAEQNVNSIRTLQINEWNLEDIKSGEIQFFRPVPK